MSNGIPVIRGTSVVVPVLVLRGFTSAYMWRFWFHFRQNSMKSVSLFTHVRSICPFASGVHSIARISVYSSGWCPR